MAALRVRKRIDKVVIEWRDDPYGYDQIADYLGEFTNDPKGAFAFERRYRNNGEYAFFVPANQPARKSTSETYAAACKRALTFDADYLDYRRMFSSFTAWVNTYDAFQDWLRAEDYGTGWSLQDCRAYAVVECLVRKDHWVTEQIDGVWLGGIETDADDSYRRDIETEQLDELRSELLQAEFTAEEIDAAFARHEVV